jgi:hypothetical protein
MSKNIYNKKNRLKEINDYIDNNIENNIDALIEKYKIELTDYTYIKSIVDFCELSLRGPLKYINKYDGFLRSGGLLIKIFNKNNNWYGKIKQFSGKTYNISFDSNHIFYIKNKKDLFKEWMVCFISDYDNGKYN